MKPLSIQATNFMAFDDSISFEFPQHGMTVLTGDNGAGKSSILEAIAFGLYGQTIRGESPWREGEAGTLILTTDDGLNIARSVTKSGAKKLAAFKGEKPVEGSTPSKVQESLNALVHPFNEWMQTHVFTSDDAVKFSLSTDAERKRFLEGIFGLDRLDKAYTQALTKFQIDKSKLDLAARNMSQKEFALETCTAAWKQEQGRTVSEFKEPAPPQNNPPSQTRPSETDIAYYRAELENIQEKLAQLRMARDSVRESNDITLAKFKAKAELDAVEKELRLVKSGKCPTCTRSFESNHLADVSSRQSALESIYLKAVEKHTEDQARCVSERERLSKEIKAAETLINNAIQYKQTLREWESFDRAQRQHEVYVNQLRTNHENEVSGHDARIEGLAKAVQSADDAMKKATAEHSKAKADLAVSEAVCKVLGTKGIRSRLLDGCLSGLQAVTNYWLERMGSMSIVLSSTSEKKDGKGSFNEISLTIKCARCSKYAGLSTGERRRVDAAIILALAEVVGSLHENKPGLVAFDEVFDSLDARGSASVSRALMDLSAKRSVLVITHSQALAKSIGGAHYRIEKGRIEHA